MAKKKSLLVLVRKFLKKSGKTKIELAYILGYKSSSTINNWIYRKRVPEYMRARIEEVVK